MPGPFKTTPICCREEACSSILNSGPESLQRDSEHGEQRGKILPRACTLAKDLMELPVEERWRVLSIVWLDMLIYGARNCRGDIHARTLSRGGELLSLVWLLMAHFGLINIGDHERQGAIEATGAISTTTPL